jgi:hypothetical protein
MTQESSGEQPASMPEREAEAAHRPAEPGPEAPRPAEAEPEATRPAEAGPETHRPAEAEPEKPRPAGAERAPATGDARVDEALASLEGLGEAPDSGHVEAFERVHQELQEILDEVGGQGRPSRNRGPGG